MDFPGRTEYPEDPWWTKREFQIKMVESEDSHVTEMYARQVDGEWEYALVRWSHWWATPICLVRAGKVIGPEVSGFEART